MGQTNVVVCLMFLNILCHFLNFLTRLFVRVTCSRFMLLPYHSSFTLIVRYIPARVAIVYCTPLLC